MQVVWIWTKTAVFLFHPKLLSPRSTRRTPTCDAAPRTFRWPTSTSGRYGGRYVDVDEGAVIAKGSCTTWSWCGQKCLSASTWLCHFGNIRLDMEKKVRRQSKRLTDTARKSRVVEHQHQFWFYWFHIIILYKYINIISRYFCPKAYRQRVICCDWPRFLGMDV